MSQDIDEVKQVTGAANSTVSSVIDQLRPIKKQLDEWQETYGDTNATSDDINNALIDANNTGRNSVYLILILSNPLILLYHFCLIAEFLV